MNHSLKVLVRLSKIQVCCKSGVNFLPFILHVQLMETGLNQLLGLPCRGVSQIHHIWFSLLRPGTSFLWLTMPALSTYFRHAKPRPVGSQRSKPNHIKINIQFGSAWSEQRAPVMFLKRNWLCRCQSGEKMRNSSWKQIECTREISEIQMRTGWLHFALKLSGYSVDAPTQDGGCTSTYGNIACFF